MSVVVFYYLLYLDAMHMTIAIHPLQVVGKCCEIIRAPIILKHQHQCAWPCPV